jgi:glycosyltransferase involved in cell wall biosynthesis
VVRIVVHYIASTAFGGTEQSMLHLAGGLNRTRWRPVVLYHPEPGLEPMLVRAQQLGIESRAVRRATGPGTLVRVLRDLRPDLFHAHLDAPLACTSALAAAAIARVPGVVATEQLWVDLGGARSLFLASRLIARLVDRYVAVSHAVAAQLRSPYGVPGRKIVVVPNGIPIRARELPRPELRAELARTTSGWLVLTAARLDSQKGHEHLVRAAALVPEATFVLAGDGPLRSSIQELARNLGVTSRMVFLGHRDDVPSLLASCDVFALPSLYEGLPLSLLEAMASGRPAIATDVAGSNEVVQHAESGLLVPPGDPVALGGAIRRLLTDRVEAERLARAGCDRVEREFSVERMVRGVEAVYDQALASPRILGRVA